MTYNLKNYHLFYYQIYNDYDWFLIKKFDIPDVVKILT